MSSSVFSRLALHSALSRVEASSRAAKMAGSGGDPKSRVASSQAASACAPAWKPGGTWMPLTADGMRARSS
jgi:hypothetical protein